MPVCSDIKFAEAAEASFAHIFRHFQKPATVQQALNVNKIFILFNYIRLNIFFLSSLLLRFLPRRCRHWHDYCGIMTPAGRNVPFYPFSLKNSALAWLPSSRTGTEITTAPQYHEAKNRFISLTFDREQVNI